jgi:hypothetical protein
MRLLGTVVRCCTHAQLVLPTTRFGSAAHACAVPAVRSVQQRARGSTEDGAPPKLGSESRDSSQQQQQQQQHDGPSPLPPNRGGSIAPSQQRSGGECIGTALCRHGHVMWMEPHAYLQSITHDVSTASWGVKCLSLLVASTCPGHRHPHRISHCPATRTPISLVSMGRHMGCSLPISRARRALRHMSPCMQPMLMHVRGGRSCVAPHRS